MDNNNCLFNKLWNNKIIRFEILKHIRIYNLHSYKTFTFNSKELKQFKFKEYLLSICLKEIYQDDLNCNLFPSNLEYIKFPTHFNGVLTGDMLPNTLKTIEFGEYEFSKFNQPLGNWVPKHVTKLSFGNCFHQDIKISQLPETLTQLILPRLYKGVIEVGAIPKSVNNLSYKVNSTTNSLDKYAIPLSTTTLEFDYSFNLKLSQSDIPGNVTSLSFGHQYNIEINSNVLPQSITSLNLLGYSLVLYENVLPLNLTSLELNILILPINLRNVLFSKTITTLKLVTVTNSINTVVLFPNLIKFEIVYLKTSLLLQPDLFPCSITYIKLDNYNHSQIPFGYFHNNKYLNTLIMFMYKFEIPFKTLPDSLTTLVLGRYDLSLNENIFNSSSSLSTLYLGEFNHDLEINQLPQTITSLSFGINYSKSFKHGVLPCNLKELSILNPNYNQPIQDIQLPHSLKSIYISVENYKFLTNLDLDFVTKYIKYK